MSKKRISQQPDTPGGSEASSHPEQHVEIVRANLNRVLATASEFATIYANDVQVQTSPWDIRLIFGVIQDSVPGPPPGITVKQTGEVRFSPQLAKKLTLILINQLRGYESKFGQIPQPED